MTILLTGATGMVGRSLTDQLLDTGATLRALSRRPEDAGLPTGVEVVAGDLQDPDSLASALTGVQTAYLSAGGRVAGFARAARDAGVEKVVVTSGLDSDPAMVEHVLTGAGLAWVHLRPTAFAANALRFWGDTIRTENAVRFPYPRANIAPIHEADIAAVAATVLTEDGHLGQRYTLTGPESLTHRDEVTLIGHAIGREITLIEETHDQARRRLLASGYPGAVADTLLGLWADAVERPATVHPDVEKVTGRPAHTFADWADDHAGDFR
jgi:uncharacterized protein YbjT (DUF2867 family)